MKFFAIFFLAATLVCGIFWYTDEPGSGMAYPTVICGVLGAGVLLYNWLVNGDALSDKTNH